LKPKPISGNKQAHADDSAMQAYRVKGRARRVAGMGEGGALKGISDAK